MKERPSKNLQEQERISNLKRIYIFAYVDLDYYCKKDIVINSISIKLTQNNNYKQFVRKTLLMRKINKSNSLLTNFKFHLL